MMTDRAISNEVTTYDDDFGLTTEQMVFMINIHPAAEKADKADNFAFFDTLVASDEWQSLFDNMSWDQAYDRYEIVQEVIV